MIENGLREALQNRKAAFGTKRGPFRECAARSSNRSVDLICTAGAHIGEMFAIDRRAVGELALGFDALAIDEVIRRDIYASDFRGCHYFSSWRRRRPGAR